MKYICVFCGSSPGRRAEYAEAARKLGHALAKREIGLVYGAASIGVMGMLADAVLEQGGMVTGVIPKHLVAKEITHNGLTELHIVEDMHERKALMGTLSQGFIALPGGLGTLEELFEVLTWNQLGIHKKPVGLLNVCGYYDLLDGLLRHAEAEAFLKTDHRTMLRVETDCEVLVDAVSAERIADPVA